jgi:hypothetical protein
MRIITTLQPDGWFIAIDADNYEAESDSIGAWSNSPAGYGKTKEEAIAELLEEIEERAHEAERKHYA